MNNMIRDKVKEIVNLQEIIKMDNLRYKSKSRKVYIHEGHSSLKDADDEQSNFGAKIKKLDEDKKTIEKELF